MTIPKFIISLSAIVLVGLPISGAGAKYTFPQQDPQTATRKLVATVRIFSSETDGNQLGSGFVIDSDDGLVLTAAHVINNLHETAWVAFPRANDRHRAKIIFATVSPDLAIMKLDPTVQDLDSLEVQFDKIDSESLHQLTGYGRSNSEPEEGSGKPAWTDDCTYTMKTQTVHGDSGSAVLTPEGLVDGIAIKGAESGGTDSYSEMKVLPLSCVMTPILDSVSDKQTEAVMKTLLYGSEISKQHAFQPPAGPGWISNLRLARALVEWIGSQKTNKLLLNSNIGQEALEIIVERHLGYKIAMEFTQAISPTEKAAADALQRFGDAELSKGSYQVAVSAYSEATKLYLNYTAHSRPFQNGKTPSQLLDFAGAYKDAADNMTKLADVTGKKEDYDVAASFAAGAVLYAPNGKLRADSWASLGTAWHKAGKVAVAVPAYKAAITEGSTASWVSQGLVSAQDALGVQSPTTLTQDYLAKQVRGIDAYERQM